MIPAYIIDKEKQKDEQDNRIQLEIPDYTTEYEIWKRIQEDKKIEQESETVVIIDIY